MPLGTVVIQPVIHAWQAWQIICPLFCSRSHESLFYVAQQPYIWDIERYCRAVWYWPYVHVCHHNVTPLCHWTWGSANTRKYGEAKATRIGRWSQHPSNSVSQHIAKYHTHTRGTKKTQWQWKMIVIYTVLGCVIKTLVCVHTRMIFQWLRIFYKRDVLMQPHPELFF